MSELPHQLYRAADVRALDRIAIGQHGIPGLTLMTRAGAAVFGAVRRRWPRARRLAVVCGSGNNAGDGYVVARLARAAGWQVDVYQIGERGRLTGDALAAFTALGGAGVAPQPLAGQRLDQVDVVIDALLGIGLDREVTGAWRAAIEAINASGRPVVAIDVPSGLDADTGAVMGVAVRAALTVTLIGLKRGLFTGAGPACCGEVVFDALQVPDEAYQHVGCDTHRFAAHRIAELLPPRPRDAHKGCFGHVLVVGGDDGMPGAVRMAGAAAARIGAGLVTLATRAAHAPALTQARPELMCHGVETAPQLRALMARATVIAIGPGLGRSDWSAQMLAQALDSRLPLVLDADALNLLAAAPERRANWVLTPHPGEAARLLAIATARVQQDRFAAARALQQRYGGVTVLKGAGTLVCDGEGPLTLCDAGNPGMAGGGMGDVLTGVIAGLIAQQLAPRAAAAAGVWLHAAAADAAARRGGERGMLASDLMPHLRRLVNPGRV